MFNDVFCPLSRVYCHLYSKTDSKLRGFDLRRCGRLESSPHDVVLRQVNIRVCSPSRFSLVTIDNASGSLLVLFLMIIILSTKDQERRKMVGTITIHLVTLCSVHKILDQPSIHDSLGSTQIDFF